MAICLKRDADLHMTQLMPLPLSCFRKIQIGLFFWYWLTWVDPEKGPSNGCVCVLLVTSCAIRIRSHTGDAKCHREYVKPDLLNADYVTVPKLCQRRLDSDELSL